MTLIEMMVVVAIVGVLAALAIVGYRKWQAQARVADGKDIMLGIVQGLTSYYNDTQGYLDCSGPGVAWSGAAYYPMPPNGKKHQFHKAGHTDHACWNLLASDSTAPTYLSFVLHAGNAGTAMAKPPTKETFAAWKSPQKPWFVLLAVGDTDEDGVLSYWVSNSTQPNHIHVENPDE